MQSEGMTRAEVETALTEPVSPGQVRILFCQACGALTYIRHAGNVGMGEPLVHFDHHEKLNALVDEVAALRARVAELEPRNP
jgi:hypothetical protein